MSHYQAVSVRHNIRYESDDILLSDYLWHTSHRGIVDSGSNSITTLLLLTELWSSLGAIHLTVHVFNILLDQERRGKQFEQNDRKLLDYKKSIVSFYEHFCMIRYIFETYFIIISIYVHFTGFIILTFFFGWSLSD